MYETGVLLVNTMLPFSTLDLDLQRMRTLSGFGFTHMDFLPDELAQRACSLDPEATYQ